MIPIPKTLLAAMCTLALASAGAVVAAEPDDPKAEPAESHHGGGDAGKHSRTAHPLATNPHDHDPGEHSHVDGPGEMHVPCWSDSDDPDKIFALKMRQHHKMIVEAAQAELQHGDSAELRATAQAAITFHGAELAKLDAWLTANAVHPDQLPSDCGHHFGHHGHGRGPMAPLPPFATLDVDRDGFVEHSELVDTHPWHRHYAMIDTNADGKLTEAEIAAHNAAMARGDVAPRLTAAPHPAMLSGAATIAATDDNRDGFLMRAELATEDMLYQHFTAADTNNDGKLSAAEIDAHHAQMHGSTHH